MKKTFLALFVALCLLTVPPALSADVSYSLDALSLEVSLPDSYSVLVPPVAQSDPYAAFGFESAEEASAYYEEYGDIYLDAVSEDLLINFYIAMNEDEQSQAIYNLDSLSEEELKSYIDEITYLSGEDELYYEYTKKETFSHIDGTFLRLALRTKDTDDAFLLQYRTIVNGQTISFCAVTYGAAFSLEEEREIEQIVKNARFTAVTRPSPDGSASAGPSGSGSSSPASDLAALFVPFVVVVFSVISSLASKKKRASKGAAKTIPASAPKSPALKTAAAFANQAPKKAQKGGKLREETVKTLKKERDHSLSEQIKARRSMTDNERFLEQASILYKNGLLTREEFEKKKALYGRK